MVGTPFRVRCREQRRKKHGNITKIRGFFGHLARYLRETISTAPRLVGGPSNFLRPTLCLRPAGGPVRSAPDGTAPTGAIYSLRAMSALPVAASSGGPPAAPAAPAASAASAAQPHRGPPRGTGWGRVRTAEKGEDTSGRRNTNIGVGEPLRTERPTSSE